MRKPPLRRGFFFMARGKKRKAGDKAGGPGKKNMKLKNPICRKV
jgi:hypothetical protein